MLLTIDVGNTNIVLGLFEEDELLFTGRITTGIKRTSDEFGIVMLELLYAQRIDRREIDGVIISSVVPQVTGTVKGALEKLSGKTPLVVGPGVKTGLNIRIENPSALGSDLVVDAVAGLAEYPTPLLIIDMGTATTISAIDKNGVYLGGVIIPGAKVALDSLSSKASQLQPVRDALEKDFLFAVQEVAAHNCLNGEIINRAFDKGKGVRIVAKALGFDLADTIGFGDSTNDTEMIQTVATSVCMENGSPGLKAISNMICPSVEADGLAWAFEKLGLC